MKHDDSRNGPKAEKFALTVIPDKAFNAETPTRLLAAAITPIEHFFVRNNGTIPELAPGSEWSLSIEGLVAHPQTFTLQQLRQTFDIVEVTAVLECAGNGRSEFEPATDGLQWGRGAVGCARWTGVRLADVLRKCGLRDGAVYTGHHSDDRFPCGTVPALSRGIPIAQALASETLLAFKMNGAPLPPLHGAPLRLVAPEMPESAWQKWLKRIEVIDRVHDGEKMRGTDYRLPRIPVRPGEPIDESLFEVIERMPINSLITSHEQQFRTAPGEMLDIVGHAWSGEASVAEVAISTDGGLQWTTAVLAPEVQRYAWRPFEAQARSPLTGLIELLACATDVEGRSQPIEPAPWNPRGYCNNSAHRVRGRA